MEGDAKGPSLAEPLSGEGRCGHGTVSGLWVSAVFGVRTALREPGRIGSILGSPVPARRRWRLSRVLKDKQVARGTGS